eukprot:7336-Heterococcus_DN1.PRE.2
MYGYTSVLNQTRALSSSGCARVAHRPPSHSVAIYCDAAGTHYSQCVSIKVLVFACAASSVHAVMCVAHLCTRTLQCTAMQQYPPIRPLFDKESPPLLLLEIDCVCTAQHIRVCCACCELVNHRRTSGGTEQK